nr:hypothetical protein [uncultured Sphaerochaeta sp.]
MSHFALIGAYFISVAYYLVLLATFGLKLVGWSDPMLGKIIATTLIVLIAGVGATKGLSGIERTEKYTVGANLSVIAALLVSLAIFGVTLPSGYSWSATQGRRLAR